MLKIVNTKGFEVIFDDDSAGEAADLVCFKEEEDYIRLILIHCKFSGAAEPSERVKDVVGVCSQAIRSSKWKWKFHDLCRHIIIRDRKLSQAARPTRFILGTTNEINKFLKLSKFKVLK